MANTARQYKEYQSAEQVKKVRVVKQRTSPFTLGEKVIAMVFVAFVCIASLQIITAQAEIYNTNKDIQNLETTIVSQQNINDDLSIQISQMSTYERVWEKAKELGLTLDEANVKVVQQP
ncbi:cell division protein FtsL [Jeotgalibacillus sp. ET6]|uniref:cell division protein FtsL n=1 Tax=Jeotgalibacillus sp. ET6 TaxID=3037260 RepID=UPI002418991B|nr:cell division protein FtsL [Jeotgalibacillus sp. ET6]MDG5470197.1 cell division protein FtsL [Jeotgalibacillus sp. ET6]